MKRSSHDRARWGIGLLVAAMAMLAALFAGTGSAVAANSVPWADPNVTGSIGFCDASGHQIHSGSTRTFPFVRLAVSTVAPPKGYTAPYGRALLYAYQPIQYVDPGDWSGRQMTSASAFTNNAAPMTQGLGIDPSLFNFANQYPLHWNGLAQIRMYYTAPDKPEWSTTYPATAIQVSGSTWTQIGAPTVNCKAGATLSNEHILPEATKTNQNGDHRSSSAGASGSSANGSSGSGQPSGSGSAGSSLQSSAAASSKARSSGSGGVIAAVIVVVAVLAGGGGYWFVRRRRGVAS